MHERSLDSDFLLVLLRDLLQKRRDLKLVLMSATLNASHFSNYFGGCPVLTIPGFTYPVKEIYLEDVVETLKYQPSPGAADVRRVPALGAGRPTAEEREELEAYTALGKKGYSRATVNTLTQLDQSKLNPELIARLVRHIVKERPPGAVLIFMSGLMEITAVHDALRAQGEVLAATGQGRWLVALHSSLSTAQQSAIFERPPEGTRKVAIATNIAETSITIDDVVYVIDTGRHKENQYRAETHMQSLVSEWRHTCTIWREGGDARALSLNIIPQPTLPVDYSTLHPHIVVDWSKLLRHVQVTVASCLLPQQEGWVSRASARQRRGRAGRVQPGVCFRLYTRWMHDRGDHARDGCTEVTPPETARSLRLI